MTPATLSAHLDVIGWSRWELSRRLGYRSVKSITQWRVVPADVAAYVEAVAEAVGRVTVPVRNLQITVDTPPDCG
jgi:hypothetical protein